MAKIDTFYAPFNGSSLGAEWQLTTTNPTSATETGGNLEIQSLSGSVFAGVETVDTFDWTNSSIVFEVPSVGATTPQSVFLYAVPASGNGPGFRFNGDQPAAGFISGTPSYGNYATGTTGRRFARLTHNGTNIVYETSTDGVTYTTLHTQAVGSFGTVTASRLRILTLNASVTTLRVATIGTAPASGVVFRPYFITG